MNYYKRHLGDLAKSCSHLSQGALGAYDLLIDWIYANEKPLPRNKDDLYRIGRAYTKAERENVDRVLGEFFIITPAGYTQKRITEELVKYAAKCEKNKEAGKLGGRPKKTETVSDSVSDSETETVIETEPRNNPSQNPESTKEARSKSLGQQAARFEDFWTVYPNKKGKADAMKAWKRKRLDDLAERIIADVLARAVGDRQWLDGYIPHGSTYVNGEGWQDAIEPPKARVNGGGYVPLPGEV